MRKPYVFLLKNIALISSSRAYYVALHFTILYIVSFFLLGSYASIINKLLDSKIHLIILCSSLSLTSGFIINNFYDSERDLLSKPFRIFINNLISVKSKLTIYLFFNILALILAVICSFNIFFLILLYQFLMWFYSHKLKKIIFLNNLTYTFLIFYPYLLMVIYFKSYSTFILSNGFLCFILIYLSDIFKDFKSAKLDLIYNYATIPNCFSYPKKIIYFLIVITLFLLHFLLFKFYNSFIFYYYLFGIFILFYSLSFTYQSQNNKNIGWLGLIIKFYVLVGIFIFTFAKFNFY